MLLFFKELAGLAILAAMILGNRVNRFYENNFIGYFQNDLKIPGSEKTSLGL